MPQDRDEFYKGLISIIIDDGYADFINRVEDRKIQSIETYTGRVILQPKGIYFITNGGYSEQKFNRGLKKIATIANIVVLALAAIAAIVYAWWEIRKDVKGYTPAPQTQCCPQSKYNP